MDKFQPKNELLLSKSFLHCFKIRPVKFPATEILALCRSSPVFFQCALYTQRQKFSHQKLVAESVMSQTVQKVYMRTRFIRSNAALE